MMTFILVIHAITCILLAFIILMQSGRGGGLTEQFASAESMFGTKTNTMLVKTTTVLAIIFILTACSLAYLSAKKQQSLMERVSHAPKKMNIEIPIKEDPQTMKMDVTPSAQSGAQKVQELAPKSEAVTGAVPATQPQAGQ